MQNFKIAHSVLLLIFYKLKSEMKMLRNMMSCVLSVMCVFR